MMVARFDRVKVLQMNVVPLFLKQRSETGGSGLADQESKQNH